MTPAPRKQQIRLTLMIIVILYDNDSHNNNNNNDNTNHTIDNSNDVNNDPQRPARPGAALLAELPAQPEPGLHFRELRGVPRNEG